MPFTCSPPNLRIWAERDYNIDKGMTQGESRDGNIIGAEGAGMQSDQQIVVYSEWLAHDGSALPEGLSAVDGAQYGLTGRLAKVAGPTCSRPPASRVSWRNSPLPRAARLRSCN